MKTIDIQERRLEEDVSAGLNNNAPPLLESPFCFIYILIRNENGSKCHQAIMRQSSNQRDIERSVN